MGEVFDLLLTLNRQASHLRQVRHRAVRSGLSGGKLLKRKLACIGHGMSGCTKVADIDAAMLALELPT